MECSLLRLATIAVCTYLQQTRERINHLVGFDGNYLQPRSRMREQRQNWLQNHLAQLQVVGRDSVIKAAPRSYLQLLRFVLPLH